MRGADPTASSRSFVGVLCQRVGREGLAMRIWLLLLALLLVLAVLLPLWAMLSKSLEGPTGAFVGLANFQRYLAGPGLTVTIWHSLFVSVTATAITLAIAFVYAYALQRSCMRWRGFFRTVALLPLLAPSLLPGLSLVYLFGNHGPLRWLLMGHSIYGPIGIVIGEVFFAFPLATMIILSALSATDQRLYEAARALRARRLRIFLMVTLPGCRYGIISAGLVVFMVAFTDFGVPKIIGGSYEVLATDVYKQVIGQFNFNLGAVVGVLLLVPAVLAFSVDRLMQRRQVVLLSARAIPYQAKPDVARDMMLFGFCAAVAVLILAILAAAALGSVATYWPYDLTPTIANYDFGNFDAQGWSVYTTSLKMATLTALIGTVVIFTGAYLVEKSRGWVHLRNAIHFLCMLPLAVPGLVLGLSYILFFGAPTNPLNFLYLTLAILVLNTIVHFYTVGHLTAVTALKQLDPEFEAVGLSLKSSVNRVALWVTVPICLPAIIDIAVYLFVNAMTTVSAVVFLYSPDTRLAAISILNLDDYGNTAPAMAMSIVIVATSGCARLLQVLAVGGLERRTQAWRQC